MAGVSGLRAQFETLTTSGTHERPSTLSVPQNPATSKSTPTTPVGRRKEENGGKKDHGKTKGSPKVSKTTVSKIGKSISAGPGEGKKCKSNKSHSIDESNKKKGKKEERHSESAMAALADVIKSSSSSPRSSKLSLSCSSEGSPSPLVRSSCSNDGFSSTENSLQPTLERSGEFSLHEDKDEADSSDIHLRRRTDSSEKRKERSLSTPLASTKHLRIETGTISPPANQSKPVLKPKPKPKPKPAVHPKPATLDRPKKAPKPTVGLKPTLKITVSKPEDNQSEKEGEPKHKTLVDGNQAARWKREEKEDQKAFNSQVSNNKSNKISDASGEDTPDGDHLEAHEPPSNTSPLTNSHENENDMLASLKVSRVQSQAHATPKGDVGGCKRGNTDSGFQEEAYEDEKTKLKEGGGGPSPTHWDAEKLEKCRLKRHKIAMELLDTEKSYVGHLKIIAEDFRSCIQGLNAKSNKPVIPETTINLIFLNIGEIHNLNMQLMKDLQQRMDEWDSKEKIGDVISSIAPFLKLYSTYTAGFEDSMKILTESMAKEKKLDTAVKEFERRIGSGLGVTHYMLEPVQRIPRYKLLLTEYLKHLPEDSDERPLAQKSLDIISEAADRTNNRIKELENSNEILAIERSLTDYEGSLLLAHRRFLKKGILQKLSRKTQTPRMFFLFSDILLHTEVTSPSTFKFKDEVPLCGMKLEVPKVSLVPHSFEILGTTRSFILSASHEGERDEWMGALMEAINDDREKRKSIKRDQSQIMTVNRSEFGVSAPIMVPDQNVSQCQLCSKDFTFTFRRHHCRACGRVVCGHCSPFKAYLNYSKKEERICVVCNQRRQSVDHEDVDCPATSPLREQSLTRPNIPSILFVDPKEREEEAVMEGYVFEQDGKKWIRCWYMLAKDLALYKFRAHEDIRATETVPLPGYKISEDSDNLTITLAHPQSKKKKHNLKFKVESNDELKCWVDVMDKATRLEVPEPVIRDVSPSHLSTPKDSPPDRKRSQSVSDILMSDDRQELDISV